MKLSKSFVVIAQVTALENAEKLKTIHVDAKNDCAAWIENMLFCDPMQSKTVKFVHRMNKVLNDAVWHLAGAKKCRSANNIGKWAHTPVYRKKRSDEEYTLDDYYYDSNYNATDYYGSDEYAGYGNDYYGEYDNYTETLDQRALDGPGSLTGFGAGKILSDDATTTDKPTTLTVTRADTTTTAPATPYDFGDDDAGWEEKDRNYGKPTKKPTKNPGYNAGSSAQPDGSGSAKLEAKCNASLDKFFAHEGISLCGKVGSWMRRTNGLIRQVHGHGKLCKDSDSTTTGYAISSTNGADTTTYQPTTTTTKKPVAKKPYKKPGKKPGKKPNKGKY